MQTFFYARILFFCYTVMQYVLNWHFKIGVFWDMTSFTRRVRKVEIQKS